MPIKETGNTNKLGVSCTLDAIKETSYTNKLGVSCNLDAY